jgi:hypothetical protein
MPVPMWSVRFYKKDPESTYGFMTEPTPNYTNDKALIDEFAKLIHANQEEGRDWRIKGGEEGNPKYDDARVWRVGGGVEGNLSVGTLWRHEKVGRIVMVSKCLREESIYNVGASLYRLAAGRWDER